MSSSRARCPGAGGIGIRALLERPRALPARPHAPVRRRAIVLAAPTSPACRRLAAHQVLHHDALVCAQHAEAERVRKAISREVEAFRKSQQVRGWRGQRAPQQPGSSPAAAQQVPDQEPPPARARLCCRASTARASGT